VQFHGADQRFSYCYNCDRIFLNRRKRSADESSCGLSDSSIEEWMKKVQNSAVEEPSPVIVILNIVWCWLLEFGVGIQSLLYYSWFQYYS